MSGDLTDLLLESLSDADVEYEEPHDLVTVDEVELYTQLNTPGQRIRNANKIPFEKLIGSYELPTDVTPEEMKEIVEHINLYGRIYVHTPETKQRIAISMTGTHRSSETKEKISSKMKCRQLSDEHKQHISTSMSGKKRKPMSEETKEKIRQSRIQKEQLKKQSQTEHV